MSDPDLDLIQQTHDAHAALMARINGFLDQVDGDVATAIALAQTQLGIRQAAYDALAADLAGIVDGRLYQRIFVDPTNGNDANDGLSLANALQTIPAAYAKAIDGGHLDIRLPDSAVASFVGAQNCVSNRLTFSSSNTGTITTRPKITGGQTNMRFGSIELTGIDLDGSTGQLFKSYGSMDIKTLFCDVVVGNAPIFGEHSSEPNHIQLNCTHTHLTDAAGATSPKFMDANTWAFTGTSVSVPSGKTWADYLYVVRDAAGVPINGLSNLAI